MANDWLKNQLTKSKKASPLWSGLADAVQQIFDEQVRPLTNRVASLNSYFTMHQEDLDRRLSELGSFFYFGANVEQDSIPLAVMQKLDEIHFKRTALPIQNAISREFRGIKINWQPLYAPKEITPANSKDYTKKEVDGLTLNALRTATEIANAQESIDDYFLTSRGILEIPVTQLANSGYTQSEFSAVISRIIMPLVPTDIVYDGERFLIHYDIIEPLEKLFLFEQSVTELFDTIYIPPEKISSKVTSTDDFTLDNSLPIVEGYVNRIDAINLDFWQLDNLA